MIWNILIHVDRCWIDFDPLQQLAALAGPGAFSADQRHCVPGISGDWDL